MTGRGAGFVSHCSAALFLLVLGVSSPLHANSPNVGRDGGAIFPLRTDSIQLVSESVVVDLSNGSDAPTTCTYLLRNLQPHSQTIEMSFLIPPTYIDLEVEGPPGTPVPYNSVATYRESKFVVTVKDEQVPVEMLTPQLGAWGAYASPTPATLPVWKVFLGPKEEVSVEMSFVSAWPGNTYKGRTYRSYRYLAKVASLWAGRIEYASIVFKLGNVLSAALQAITPSPTGFQYKILPKDYQWTDFGVQWERKEWEPTEDFGIDLEYQAKEQE